MWLNQTILTTSVDLWWLIMTFSFWKSWIWLLLSKKNTFYCTLNLTQFSNFTVTLTLSCYQTWWDGLDLTCPSFRGLNFDDFPFFWTFERTSGSRDRPILRFIGNWWHFRNIKDGAVQLPAAKSSSSSYDDDMMMMRRRRMRRIWWWWWWYDDDGNDDLYLVSIIMIIIGLLLYCIALHCTIFDISEMSPIFYKS